jgi:hypothetical protein
MGRIPRKPKIRKTMRVPFEDDTKPRRVELKLFTPRFLSRFCMLCGARVKREPLWMLEIIFASYEKKQFYLCRRCAPLRKIAENTFDLKGWEAKRGNGAS